MDIFFCNFCSKKKNVGCIFFLQFLVIKTLDPYPDPEPYPYPDPYPLGMLDPDPVSFKYLAANVALLGFFLLCWFGQIVRYMQFISLGVCWVSVDLMWSGSLLAVEKSFSLNSIEEFYLNANRQCGCQIGISGWTIPTFFQITQPGSSTVPTLDYIFSVGDPHWCQCRSCSGSSFLSQFGSGFGSREPNQCGSGSWSDFKDTRKVEFFHEKYT